jgi:hypothetical protein
MILKKHRWSIIFVVGLLLISTLACGTTSNNSGEKVGENTAVSKTESTAAQGSDVEASKVPEAKTESTKAPDSYTIGDVIELDDQRITLNGGDYKGGILKVNFTIENIGKDDLALSSLISFSAKDNEGTKLEQEIFDCGSGFDGKVIPGDKVRGDLCYKLTNPGEIKLYYEASLFGSGAVVWKIDTSALTGVLQPPAGSDTSASKIDAYAVGDIVELNDQKITLNSASIVGNLLKANFTIENTGAEDLAVSSMLSFYAKTNDGTKLEQNLFDCGSAQVDGKILPADKVKGDICWDTGGVAPIKIYYEASMLGSGAVVWEVK